MQTWNETETTIFLEAAKHTPYYALYYLALFTGMRRSELLALRWQDVDFILSQVYVNRTLHHLMDGSYVFTQPKSEKSRRAIALSPSVTLMLKRHREQQECQRALIGVPLTDDDLVFSTLEGKAMRPNTVSRPWTILAARCGLKVISFHCGRHTHASAMLRQGVHPKVVQERLGHSTISTTLDIYSHTTPGLQAAAAARFDEWLGVAPKGEVEREAIRKVG